jgi:hypothetical protein
VGLKLAVFLQIWFSPFCNVPLMLQRQYEGWFLQILFCWLCSWYIHCLTASQIINQILLDGSQLSVLRNLLRLEWKLSCLHVPNSEIEFCIHRTLKKINKFICKFPHYAITRKWTWRCENDSEFYFTSDDTNCAIVRSADSSYLSRYQSWLHAVDHWPTIHRNS